MSAHTLEHKMHKLNKAIEAKAAELGLMFVSGPDPHEYPADQALGGLNINVQPVNHHWRGTYSFGVSEKFS